MKRRSNCVSKNDGGDWTDSEHKSERRVEKSQHSSDDAVAVANGNAFTTVRSLPAAIDVIIDKLAQATANEQDLKLCDLKRVLHPIVSTTLATDMGISQPNLKAKLRVLLVEVIASLSARESDA